MIVSYSGNAHGETLREWHNILQKLRTRIKFTMEHGSKELPFLDILIKNKNSQIITDVYHKPTDTQQYLHFNSHHPQNCIKSIPYTLTCWLYTIITDKNLRKTFLNELHTTLNQRGYQKTLINKGIELAERIPQKNYETRKRTSRRNPKHTSQLTTKTTPNYSLK